MDALTEKKEAVAARIAALLHARGWTQTELANRAGLPKSHITKVLQAGANLTLSSIVALETAFQLSYRESCEK